MGLYLKFLGSAHQGSRFYSFKITICCDYRAFEDNLQLTLYPVLILRCFHMHHFKIERSTCV